LSVIGLGGIPDSVERYRSQYNYGAGARIGG
jgi:hypothetical protein